MNHIINREPREILVSISRGSLFCYVDIMILIGEFTYL